MNILLWVLQGVLAFLYLAGGAFKAFNVEAVSQVVPSIPHGGWRALGIIEMLGGVLLVVPAALKWMPVLTPSAAAVLTLETLVLSAIYARHSLKLTQENPLLWSLVMGVMVAFVAYGRFALRPFA